MSRNSPAQQTLKQTRGLICRQAKGNTHGRTATQPGDCHMSVSRGQHSDTVKRAQRTSRRGCGVAQQQNMNNVKQAMQQTGRMSRDHQLASKPGEDDAGLTQTSIPHTHRHSCHAAIVTPNQHSPLHSKNTTQPSMAEKG